MKRSVEVKSTVIDWPEQTLTITGKDGKKYVLPLSQPIHVKMIGFPDELEQDLLAGELDPFLSGGYIIQEVTFESEQIEFEK